jgi:hypothetical protein
MAIASVFGFNGARDAKMRSENLFGFCVELVIVLVFHPSILFISVAFRLHDFDDDGRI